MSSPIWAVFACIQAMRRGGKPVEAIADLAGLARTHPKLGLIFSLLFLSLAGLPPLAASSPILCLPRRHPGGLIWPAVLGVLASAMAWSIICALVKVMYFDEPAPAFDGAMAPGSRAILVIRRRGLGFHRRGVTDHLRRGCRGQGAVSLTGWPPGYRLKRSSKSIPQ